ncbi:MAG: beta-propeller fold lactonase family protein [Terrimesophilobacter sp.]
MRPALFLAGCYTGSQGKGQGVGALRPRADGSLEYLGLAVAASSPSFVANGVGGRVVYAVDEANSRVEAFSRTDGFELLPLGGQDTSGPAPCHLAVAEHWLYVANYGSGVIDVFPLVADGRIGPMAQFLTASGRGPKPEQDGPHAHSTFLGPSVLTADLGLDQVHIHRRRDGLLTRTGSLDLPPGTGPRDFASPAGSDGSLVYVIGELAAAVFALRVRADGVSIVASGQAVAEPVEGDHGAGLQVSGDGRFLYSGLRGSNRIIVIRTSDLSPVADVSCGGDWPRNLTLVGDMLYVANQRSSTVTSFLIDADGIPRPVGEPEPVPSPTFLCPAA